MRRAPLARPVALARDRFMNDDYAMFVRFRQTRGRLQVSLVETRREDGAKGQRPFGVTWNCCHA
jgi:hypothetical protein